VRFVRREPENNFRPRVVSGSNRAGSQSPNLPHHARVLLHVRSNLPRSTPTGVAVHFPMSATGKSTPESLQLRLDWLIRHQPNNIEVINSVQSKLNQSRKSGLTGQTVNERRSKPRKKTSQPTFTDVIPPDLKADYDDFVRLFKENGQQTTNLYKVGSSTTRFHAFCLFLRDYDKRNAA